VYIKISAEHWGNDNDRGQSKYSEENVTQWQFIHHKSHTDCQTSAVKEWATSSLNNGTDFKDQENVAYTLILSSYSAVNTLPCLQKRILCEEKFVVPSEIRTKHTNSLCGHGL